MYPCGSLVHLLLSRHGVTLPINWVNAEWDFPSTEATRHETQSRLSQRGMRWYLRRFYRSALTQLTWSLALPWLSQRGVSLYVDPVNGEWDSTSTESPPNDKKFEYSANLRKKSKMLKRLILWPLEVWSMQKTRTKNLMKVYL